MTKLSLWIKHLIWQALGCLVMSSISFADPTQYGNSIYHDRGAPRVIYIVGEITESDDFEFRRALRDHEAHTVVLASPGGSVRGGLSIAGIVGDRALRVYVPTGAVCASACSYIYFAGSERLTEGALGVHQFVSSTSNTSVELGVAQQETQTVTAEILGFLREFGTPPFVAERMFRSPEMYWFTAQEISTLDTQTFSLSDADKLRMTSTLEEVVTFLQEQAETEAEAMPPLTESEIISIVQYRLNEIGCDAGVVDGIMGRQTVSALERFTASIGMNYHIDIIYEIEFIEALSNANIGACPSQPTRNTPEPRTTPAPIPLQIAGHWEMTCRASNGSAIATFFARVHSYDNRTGAITFVVRSLEGRETSLQGVVRPGSISIYNDTGLFNSSYTEFNVGNVDCPGGVKAVALL